MGGKKLFLSLCLLACLGFNFAFLLDNAQAAPLSFTQEERQWLSQHPVIRPAPDPDYAPFEWKNSDGKTVGIAPDFLKLVGEKLGVKVESIKSNSWKNSLKTVEDKMAELVTVATKTPQRSKYMAFTSPYTTFPNVILMRTDVLGTYDLTSLKGKTMAGLDGWAMTEMIKKDHPDIKIKLVKSVQEALEQVSVGRIDGVLLNMATAGYWIDKQKITNLRIAGKTAFTYKLSFASRKDWPIFNTLLEKALANISDSEQQAIFSRWISLKQEKWTPTPQFWLISGGILLCLIILIILAWNLSLKRQVAQNTEELRRAKEVAEQSNLAKTQFLANMSHEIRTPMNAVIGMCHLAMETELTDKQQDYLEKIQDGSERLLGLINNILDLFRMESGQLKLSPVTFHLDDMLDKISSRIGPKAEEKNLELLFSHILPPSFALLGDVARLEQVLFNLTDNAVKFTRSGKVLVKVKLLEKKGKKEKISFLVSDTGIGMSEDEIKQLCEPFIQLDGSTTREFGGVGLGLAVSRRLVGLMGGKLKFESELDKGTLISFELALEGVKKEKESVSSSLNNLKNLNILVVDDNDGAREIFYEMLSNLGAKVSLAASGQEAIELLGTTTFDLVLMDWKMPGLDGIETIEKIQQNPTLQNLPIILVSAYRKERAMQEASNITLAGICQKPITPTEMLSIIGKVIGEVSPEDKPSEAEEVLELSVGEITTLQTELNELAILLSQGNAQAIKLVPEIREKLNAPAYRRLFDLITRQIENYDFDEAEETVININKILFKQLLDKAK
jgi:two-component system, sensor histidine kinase and response regulator